MRYDARTGLAGEPPIKRFKGSEPGWYVKRPWGWEYVCGAEKPPRHARRIVTLGFDESMPKNDPRQPFHEPYCGIECL